jgi:hypothetical protein
MKTVGILVIAIVIAILVLATTTSAKEPFSFQIPFQVPSGVSVNKNQASMSTGVLRDGVGWGPGREINGQPFDMNGGFVAVYQDTNFVGGFRKYVAGATQNSLSKGLFGTGLFKENDTYSSILVPNGLQLTVFQDDGLKGANAVLGPGKYPNLAALPQGNWNDRISSLVVTPTGYNIAVTWYADKNFTGKKLQVYGAGDFGDLTKLSGIDSRDNMFSSVQISPGFAVTFYDQPFFQGPSKTLTSGSYASFDSSWNDKISSFKVYKT